MNNCEQKIGGFISVVEIDDAKLGKKIGECQWVFDGIDRESKEIFVAPVASANVTPPFYQLSDSGSQMVLPYIPISGNRMTPSKTGDVDISALTNRLTL